MTGLFDVFWRHFTVLTNFTEECLESRLIGQEAAKRRVLPGRAQGDRPGPAGVGRTCSAPAGVRPPACIRPTCPCRAGPLPLVAGRRLGVSSSSAVGRSPVPGITHPVYPPWYHTRTAVLTTLAPLYTPRRARGDTLKHALWDTCRRT